jgi:hypothetical protein
MHKAAVHVRTLPYFSYIYSYLTLIADRSAATHQQYTTTPYDPSQTPRPQYGAYNYPPQASETYNNNSALLAAAGIAAYPTEQYNATPNPYQSQPAQQLERNYSLGGQGYGSSYGTTQMPEPSQNNDNRFFASYQPSSPAPINTNVPVTPAVATSPVKGPRAMGSSSVQYSDSPPGYESGPSQPAGEWGANR